MSNRLNIENSSLYDLNSSELTQELIPVESGEMVRPERPLLPNIHIPENLPGLRKGYLSEPPSPDFFVTGMLRKLHGSLHVARLDYRMTTLMGMLRAYHIPYTVEADGDTIYFVEQFEEALDWDPAVHLLSGTMVFDWKSHTYRITSLPEWREAARDENSHALYAAVESLDALRILTKDLSDYTPDQSEAILQFEGEWRESLELRRNLQHCTWDALVLPDEIKNDIRENAERFFNGDKTVYERLGLSHKRGFIFIGEPGDGKTLTGKIIANTYKVNFIYVTSLESSHQTPSQCLREIYDRAADIAPCVVLIEDLDSQIDRTSRTVFLNILDGFEHNDGILTIATTNNPEDIDRALLDRPSRFDKKWIFPHPDASYRAAYLTKRLKDILLSIPVNEELEKAILDLAAKTNHYSYAMLQELVVSAGFVYFANGQSGDISQMLQEAYIKTQEQLKFGDPSKLADLAKGKATVGIRNGRMRD